MSDFSRKISYGRNFAGLAQAVSNAADDSYGRQLPCSVIAVDNIKGFVTVEFLIINPSIPLPQITIPVMGWQWIRYPIQVGDAGVTISIDVNNVFVSKIVEGNATMVPSGNLGPTLMFVPIMQKTMVESPDANATIIYGPNGVQLFDYDPGHPPAGNINAIIKLTPTEIDIKLKSGAEIKLSGNRVDINGTLFINGNQYMLHQHSDVQSGNGETGGVV